MRLINTIHKLGKPSILVIGDLILDRYVWGKVNRISPEAPIQILNVQSHENRLGGAANVAHNLITLEAQVDCFGVVGNDEAGRQLKSQLNKVKIGTKGIIIERNYITPTKTRLIAHDQQVLRVDEEKPHPIRKEIEQKLLSQLKRTIKQSDLIIASDYFKGTLPESLMQSICRLSRTYHKKLIIGPKGPNYRKYRGATAIIPNRSEAELATGIEIKDAKSQKQAAQQLLKTLKLDFVVITLGEKGIYLLTQKGTEIHDSAKSLNVYDVTGAGDTTLATLGLGLAAGVNYQTAIHLANLAAGVVVSKVGTATVSRKEIIEHFHQFNQTTNLDKQNGTPLVKRKVKTVAEIIKIIQSIMDKRIVFTNGCFDILHPGHIKTLTFARSQGDILIVGLNSDKSVWTIKGKGRPIFNQHLRAHSLAALQCIDYVVIFDEPTPYNLIRKIKPDILVKGTDWQGKKVVGENIVKSYKGKVVFAPLQKGISTSKIVEKLL